MASLYSRLNARRVGRGAGSGAPAGSGCSSAAGRRDCSSDGVDTRTGSPVLPSRSGTPHSLGVSHISLTKRAWPVRGLGLSGLRRKSFGGYAAGGEYGRLVVAVIVLVEVRLFLFVSLD